MYPTHAPGMNVTYFDPPMLPTQAVSNNQNWASYPAQGVTSSQPFRPSAVSVTTTPNQTNRRVNMNRVPPEQRMIPPGGTIADVMSKGEIRVAMDNVVHSRLAPQTADWQLAIFRKRLADLEAEERSAI